MIIADTTFVIDLLRNRGNVSHVQKNILQDSIGLSLISISELFTGLFYTKRKLGEAVFLKKSKELKSVLLSFDILSLNEAIMELSGQMRGILLYQGAKIDLIDLIIGATAKYYNAKSIITRNRLHFTCWELPILEY